MRICFKGRARRRALSLGTAVLVGIVGSFVLGGQPRSAGADARITVVPRFERASCSAWATASVLTRCGYLVVPENRLRRSRKTIRVAVAIVAAASKRPAPEPLVYLAGGPGGVPIVQARQYVSEGFNAQRDLILVDQRGTYYSQPALTCPVVDAFNQRLLGLRYDAESTRRLHVAATRSCRKRLIAMGADLSAYNTTENAADIADLRRVLGYRRWNVYGVSYGTDLALTLAGIDSDGIRSLVLDSTVPPNAVTVDAFWPNASEGFKRLFEACAQQRCGKRYPALEWTFSRLVRELETHPVTTSVKGPRNAAVIAVTTDGGALANWLVNMSFSTSQYSDVPRWIAALAARKPQSISASRAAGVTASGYVGYGLMYGVVCREWYPFRTAAQIPLAGRRAFPSYPASVLAQAPQLPYVSDDCGVWHVPRAPGSVRKRISTSVPTLILSGRFDSVTSKAWAEDAAKTLRNGRLLLFPGIGHGVVDASKCAQFTMNAFLARPLAAQPTCVDLVKPPLFR